MDRLGSDWIAYAKASIAEVIAQNDAQPVSMQWLVDGVIPEGAGLSVSPYREPITEPLELCGIDSRRRHLVAHCQWNGRYKSSKRHRWACFELRTSFGTQ
jgi:hypothetical protein